MKAIRLLMAVLVIGLFSVSPSLGGDGGSGTSLR